ncbi:uncharacterized protein DUF3866 [Flavimobilis soli]|uniref:Uncharacterized protein DUF3866 n=1 Tax=Flavimobilis soli TaxID=442709 RepID=A0A2A9EBI8_9MICO|nr:DUF3866 family protein [Flavimobilis soli]PFG35580.1 uncharacterized protein DUF3866 [Flavimobilis soli]
MINWRDGVVVSLGREWHGALETTVRTPDGSELRALAYPALVGRPAEGDRVLLNTTALDRSLGTGGYALVTALPDALPQAPPQGPGHLVKARYTPLQTMVLGVDEQESEHHETLREADSLDGMPVVVADLHSALPAIVAGVRAQAPDARIAYVMTDGGALPAWFSRTVAQMRDEDLIASCLTVGQAFGGDLEAVTVHSGLLAAKHVVGADVAVVAQGPGNLGTGTRWGFSGVVAGEVVNAVATLGGAPVASLRVSASDARSRHVGVSHHSTTAYGRVALAAADVVVPEFDETIEVPATLGGPSGLNALVDEQVTPLAARHRLVRRAAGAPLLETLRRSPVRMSSMGRNLDADPTPFLAVAAAGEHAATLLRR